MKMRSVLQHHLASFAVLLSAIACGSESNSEPNGTAGRASSAGDDSSDDDGRGNDDSSDVDDESGGAGNHGAPDDETSTAGTEVAEGGGAGAEGDETPPTDVCAGEPWDEAEFVALPCTEFSIGTTRVPEEELADGAECAFYLPLSPGNRQIEREDIDLVASTSDTTLDNYPELESLDDCDSSEYGGYVYQAPVSTAADNSGVALVCPCTCGRLGEVVPSAFACGR